MPVINIQHIGSTSVPGMIAKPIIDIAVLVNSIKEVDDFVHCLRKIGYTYYPEMSSIERLFFRKGTPVTFHLSITVSKHKYWGKQIIFRDYLRKHPEWARKYSKLKRGIVKKITKNELKDLSRSKSYNSKKAPLILKIIEIAEDELGKRIRK